MVVKSMARRRKPAPAAQTARATDYKVIVCCNEPLAENELRRVGRGIRESVKLHRSRLVARYACGHELELEPRADAPLDCELCSRRGPLLGLLARAA